MKIEKSILRFQSNGRQMKIEINRANFRRYYDFTRRVYQTAREIFTSTDAETVSVEYVPTGRTLDLKRDILPTRDRNSSTRQIVASVDDVPRLPRAAKGNPRLKRRR